MHPDDSAKVKVLVVEDSPSLRYLMRRQFELLGMSVTFAENGRVAVELATNEKFDIILMDVHMPELNGYEATAKIRDHERLTGTRTPIIAVTAFTSKADCLASGMDDFLQKPVMIEELKAMLSQWLNRQEKPVDQPANIIGAQQFKDTAQQLKSVQENLKALRKRFHLESEGEQDDR